jgi:hypothetical protein
LYPREVAVQRPAFKNRAVVFDRSSMTKKIFVPILAAMVLVGAAVPAFAFDGTDNPGTTIHEGAPYSGDDNPGLRREEARALGRKECQQFKSNFNENKQAFGKCIAAIAMDLRNEDVSAREACNAKALSHQRRDDQVRSNFKACVLAARGAENEVDATDSD